MSRLTSRVAAATVVTAVIGGAFTVIAPSAGATPTSGTVTAWGSNGSGQTNVPAAAQSSVQAIAAGSVTGYALKNGAVSAWGFNGNGETNVPAAAQSGVAAIDAQHNTAVALKADGSVVTWGWGGSAAVPTGLTGVTQVAATDDGGTALKSDHTIRTWGVNWNDPTTSPVPAAVQGHAVAVDGGFQYSAALTDTGAVVTWGQPLSSAPWRATPDAAKSGVVKMVASDERIAAIKADGSVVTWGDNDIGPVPATAMSGVVDVTVGTDWAIALKSDGSLVSWGADYGQRTIPAVAGYQVSALAAGAAFAMTIHQPATVPAVTLQPAAAALSSGDTASFSAAASGDPVPTVRWQRANPGSDLFTDIAGATATSYTTGFLRTADDGARYRAVFTNPVGTATTQPATVTVAGSAPIPGQGISEFTVPSGQTKTLDAHASGDPTPTVRWQRANPGSDQFTDIAGATATSYTTGTLTTADSGVRFQAVFTNSLGQATFGPVKITVTGIVPTVTQQPVNTYREAGQSASFSAAATGEPAPTVRWQRAAPNSDDFTDIPGATASTYSIGAVSAADDYSRYRAVFTNSAGTATTSPAALYLVQASPTPPTVSAPNAAVGQAYFFRIPVTGVLNPTVTMVSGTRPPGLTLGPDGTLSGTPTTVGNYTFRISTNGIPALADVTVRVQPPATLSGTAPDGQVDMQYQWVPTMTGSPTLTVSSGALPDGVRISNNQLITGVPTKPGVYTFTLQADNGYGIPATLTSTITIKQAPTITLPLSGGLPAGTVGTPYGFQFATSGYPAPTVSIKSGALPDNLSIDATGKITGTPTRAGLFSFTVKASNGTQDASVFTTILINVPSPAATIIGTPPDAVRNANYSYPFTLGGSPTPTVTKTSGTLPPGLTLTGATLAGQPTDNGVYTFTLTATNQYGTATLPVTMTVGTAPVFGADAPAGTVGSPYASTYPVTASPDAGVTLTGGTPPAGLTLSSGGTLAGTPQKAGVYSFTVTATNQFGTATKTQQLTINPATTGQAKVINPPASVQPGALESDTTIPVFGEKANYVLPADLKIGNTTIPAGTKVNSYYVHADAIGSANTDHPFAGTVAFGTKVLAVATSTADLQATRPSFGVSGTTYSTSVDQGLEYNDTATLSTQTTVTMNFNVYDTADAIRVITLAP